MTLQAQRLRCQCHWHRMHNGQAIRAAFKGNVYQKHIQYVRELSYHITNKMYTVHLQCTVFCKESIKQQIFEHAVSLTPHARKSSI
jgi:hypothetical protein